MKLFVAMAFVFGLGALSLLTLPARGAATADDRAAAFIAGRADPSEAFGDAEGPIWLTAAGIAVLLSFGLLALGASLHHRCRADLDTLASRLRRWSDRHA